MAIMLWLLLKLELHCLNSNAKHVIVLYLKGYCGILPTPRSNANQDNRYYTNLAPLTLHNC